VTVQSCYISFMNIVLLIRFLKDLLILLASYNNDMFFVCGQRTSALSYIPFECPEVGQCHRGRQISIFLETWFGIIWHG
jgi:hypothetical protein